MSRRKIGRRIDGDSDLFGNPIDLWQERHPDLSSWEPVSATVRLESKNSVRLTFMPSHPTGAIVSGLNASLPLNVAEKMARQISQLAAQNADDKVLFLDGATA